jgi:uncharacterized protein YjiS (DUF1127 family)
MKLRENPPAGEIVLKPDDPNLIAAYFARLARTWRRKREIRKDRKLLLELDDRLLQDIGLSRSEVRRMNLRRDESGGDPGRGVFRR